MKQRLLLVMMSTLAFAGTTQSGFCGGASVAQLRTASTLTTEAILVNNISIADGIDHKTEDTRMLARAGVNKVGTPCTGTGCFTLVNSNAGASYLGASQSAAIQNANIPVLVNQGISINPGVVRAISGGP